MSQRTRTEPSYSQSILAAVGLICFIFGLASGILWSSGKFSFRVTRYVPPSRQASVLAVARDRYEEWFEHAGPTQFRNEAVQVASYERIPRDERGEEGPRAVADVAISLSYPESGPLYLDHVAHLSCYRYGLFVECPGSISFEWTPEEVARQGFTDDTLEKLWDTDSFHFVSEVRAPVEEGEEEEPSEAEILLSVEGWWVRDALQVVYREGSELTREEIWAEGEYCHRQGEEDEWTCRAERNAPAVVDSLYSMLTFRGLNRGSEVTSANLRNGELDGTDYRVYAWREDVRAGDDTESCGYELWVNRSTQRPVRLLRLNTEEEGGDACRQGFFSGEVTAFSDFGAVATIELPEFEDETGVAGSGEQDAPEAESLPGGESEDQTEATDTGDTQSAQNMNIPYRCEGVVGEAPAGETLSGMLAAADESIDTVAPVRDTGRSWGTFESEAALHAWTFRGCAGELITVDVIAGEDEPTDPYILLFAPNDVIVGQDDDSGADLDARLMSFLPMSGTYTVVVGSYTAGDYEIRLTWEEGGSGNDAGLQVGIEAEVRTTEGDTMRIREQPSLSGDIVTYVANRAVVTIIDGPQEADGLRWWKVRTRSGYEGWLVDFADGIETLQPR